MGPDELQKESGSGTPHHTEKQTSECLSLPQRKEHAESDAATELLGRFPELALFRDEENKTWVVDGERLDRFRQSLPSSSLLSSSTHDSSDSLSLFSRDTRYRIPEPTNFKECGCENTGPLKDDVYIPDVLSPALLEKLGFKEYAELAAKDIEDFASEGSDIFREDELAEIFRAEVQVICVRIKPPDEIEIDRSEFGDSLLRTCQNLLNEARKAKRDKVGQREEVESLDVPLLHQPEWVDLRDLTVLRPVLTFNHLDLSGLPLDWIKQGAAHEKRVILFEDSTQGFAIIKNGDGRIFLHSDVPIIQSAIELSDIDREENLPELFDANFAHFISLLRKSDEIVLYHLQEQSKPSSDPREVYVVAQAIIAEGSEFYIKSSRSSGGERIVTPLMEMEPRLC